jgi:hypothetical protein
MRHPDTLQIDCRVEQTVLSGKEEIDCHYHVSVSQVLRRVSAALYHIRIMIVCRVGGYKYPRCLDGLKEP